MTIFIKRSILDVWKGFSFTNIEAFINSNSHYKTQKISWWILWAGDARNINKSFFTKNNNGNWKLSIVALSSTLSKRYEPPKNKKNSSHSKRYKKGIEGGGDERQKSLRKV